jgi:hypothetical protein
MKLPYDLILRLTLQLLLLFQIQSVIGQSSIVNNHFALTNKNNLNQIYINTQVSRINKLDGKLLTDGFIVKNADTIRCKIYVPKHGMTDDCFLYIIAKLANDSIYLLSAQDINGYSVGRITMLSHRSINTGDTSCFFIKLIEKGSVTLYMRAEIPSDKELTYYFNKSGEKDFLLLKPNKQVNFFVEENYNKSSPIISKYSGPNETLILSFLAEYLQDCESVRNKISAKFYGINDVENIVRDYNSCKK